MNKMSAILFAGVVLVGCGGTEDSGGDSNALPPVASGYTRFELPTVANIQPGVDGTWCQFISEPFEADTDVVDFSGWQSAGGHHIIFYATATHPPVGTTRECSESDMVSVRFLGGIGGEGVATVGNALPDGTTFRIPKGYSLMANTHYLNATPKPLDGKGYMDLKLMPSDPGAKTVAIFVNINQNIVVAPHQSGSLDATCVVQKDMDMYLFGNHLHEYGTSGYTDITRKDGTNEMIVNNEVWSKELIFNPKFSSWTKETPFRFNVGDTVRTHCEWNNTTAEELGFPREMCVGFGFFVGESEINCVDGVWDAH